MFSSVPYQNDTKQGGEPRGLSDRREVTEFVLQLIEQMVRWNSSNNCSILDKNLA